MIDTIKIKLPNLVFEITNYRQFNTTEEEFNGTVTSFKIWEHRDNYRKNKTDYLPRLLIIQKGTNFFLTVEFSAPKLLFGENVSELTGKDLKVVVNALKKVLYKMGIKIKQKYLINSELIEMHSSKNLLLGQKYESVEILRELRKVPVDLRKYDIDVKDYRNGGEILQFYNGESAIVFYDKIADLKKPIIKSIDKNKAGLLPEVINQKILRYEVRLGNKKKLNQVLAKISDKQNIKLKDIFSSDICQKILIHYWNDLFGYSGGIYRVNPDPISELSAIHRQMNQIKIKELIFNLGLKYLLSNRDGFMGAVKWLSRKYKESSIKIIKKNISQMLSTLPNPHYQFMIDIEKELRSFKPVKKVKYYYGYEEQNNK
jgi:hypothetical protein